MEKDYRRYKMECTCCRENQAIADIEDRACSTMQRVRQVRHEPMHASNSSRCTNEVIDA